MIDHRYKLERFHVGVTTEALEVLEKERGTIPVSSYITEVLSR